MTETLSTRTEITDELARSAPSAGGWVEFRRLSRSLRRSPVGLSGAILVAVFLLIAVTADWLTPIDPTLNNLRARFQPPSWAGEPDTPLIGPATATYWLGTDQTGRDILSRIIKGSQISVIVGLTSVVVAGAIGVLLGLAAGYFGGIWDNVIMRVTDAFLAIPFIVLVVAVSGVVGPGLVTLIIILGCTGWVTYTRVIRAETLAMREREFITAARVVGQREWVIVLGHVLPNVMSSVIVLATLQVATTILAETSLSFLGLGVQPPTITWGGMLADGRQYVGSAWWMATFPGMAILLAVLGIVFLGDWLSDWLNPRLRGQ